MEHHSVEKLLKCGITTSDVVETLLSGMVIEEYEKSILVFGLIMDIPLHVVCFYNEESGCAFITTVYIADAEHFEADFKTRRIP